MKMLTLGMPSGLGPLNLASLQICGACGLYGLSWGAGCLWPNIG